MSHKFTTKTISLISILSALYVITGFIPISMFIGAQSFLALSIIVIPIIAYLLNPIEALTSTLIAGTILLAINPGSQVFGILTILLPTFGATMGSLIFRRKNQTKYIPLIFIIITIIFYTYQRPDFIWWIIPHTIAVIILILSNYIEPKLTIPLFTFASTMAEQSIMLILAITVLNLPTIAFQTAFPLMLYERLTATMGSTIVLYSIKRIIPELIPTAGEAY